MTAPTAPTREEIDEMFIRLALCIAGASAWRKGEPWKGGLTKEQSDQSRDESYAILKKVRSIVDSASLPKPDQPNRFAVAMQAAPTAVEEAWEHIEIALRDAYDDLTEWDDIAVVKAALQPKVVTDRQITEFMGGFLKQTPGERKPYVRLWCLNTLGVEVKDEVKT